MALLCVAHGNSKWRPKRNRSAQAFTFENQREEMLDYLQINDDDSDFQGISSDEQSEISGQIYDLDGDRR